VGYREGPKLVMEELRVKGLDDGTGGGIEFGKGRGGVPHHDGFVPPVL